MSGISVIGKGGEACGEQCGGHQASPKGYAMTRWPSPKGGYALACQDGYSMQPNKS